MKKFLQFPHPFFYRFDLAMAYSDQRSDWRHDVRPGSQYGKCDHADIKDQLQYRHVRYFVGGYVVYADLRHEGI
jgi:hypothetical protein